MALKIYTGANRSIVDEEAKKRIEMYSDPEEDQRLLHWIS